MLKILTDTRHRNVIQWEGDQGDFKLLDADGVARLWGSQKNNSSMNYEKFARALRFYYGGNMISKVAKKEQYKFVCDLKQLLGYNATELRDIFVNHLTRQPPSRRYANGAPPDLDESNCFSYMEIEGVCDDELILAETATKKEKGKLLLKYAQKGQTSKLGELMRLDAPPLYTDWVFIYCGLVQTVHLGD